MNTSAAMERGKHRKMDETMTVTTRSEKADMGILAKAVALQESGILVHALTVTDLSSGFTVSGTGAVEADPFQVGEGEPRFRTSALGLARLEMLRELVVDVVEQRKANPEYSQVDAPGGRTQFPWGVGMREPDVVVAGMHASTIAEYLRCTGMRARTLDVDSVLRIAADLRDAEHECVRETESAPGAAVPKEQVRQVVTDEPLANQERAGSEKSCIEPLDRGARDKNLLRIAVAAAAVVLCLVGVGTIVAVMHSGAGSSVEETQNSQMITEPEDAATGGVTSSERSEPAAVPSDSASAQQPQPWREQRVAGDQVVTASAERAQIPVKMDAPGWTRSGATAQREEFMSSDPDMRVLVSAVPTPLTTQQEMDNAVLNQLQGMQGIRIAGRAPVSYEEVYPESTTLWHVRLKDGHQISVGCQFREVTGDRLRACDTAVQYAGIDPERQ